MNLIEYRAAILLHTMEFVDDVTGGWITYDSIFNEIYRLRQNLASASDQEILDCESNPYYEEYKLKLFVEDFEKSLG